MDQAPDRTPAAGAGLAGQRTVERGGQALPEPDDPVDARGGTGDGVRVHRGVVQHAPAPIRSLGYWSPLEFERFHQADSVDRSVHGARTVNALRATTSPLDPALRAGSTPPTEVNVVYVTSLREPKASAVHEIGATSHLGGLHLYQDAVITHTDS